MTEIQYAWLQSVLGTRVPTFAAAEADLTALGSIREVALKYLRIWRTELMNGVSSVTVPGAISVSYSGILTSLSALIDEIEAGPDDPSAPPVGDGGLPTLGFATFADDFARATPEWDWR